MFSPCSFAFTWCTDFICSKSFTHITHKYLNMASSEHESIVYVKDNVYGTIFLTIDSQDPIAINFFHNVKVTVMLGVVRPDCKLERLLPEAELDQYIYKPMNITKGASDILDDIGSGSLGDAMDVCSDREKVMHIGDSVSDNETIDEYNESLVEGQEKTVLSSKKLTLPANNSSTCTNNWVRKSSCYERKTPPLEVQNMLGNEKSVSCNQRKGYITLRHRKQKGYMSKKRETDIGTAKKVASSKKVKAKLIKNKVNTYEENRSPNSSNEDEIGDGIKHVIKPGPPKEKRRAKWKLARQISCQYCLKVFENQQAFYDHKKTSRSEVFECYTCKKVFPFQAYLQAHTKAYHQDKKLFSNLKESASCICDVCGSEVKNMFALKKHLMLHTQEYFYSCCICGKQFVEPGTLNNHMITHKSGGMIRCKCCDQLFATRGALAKHKLASVEVKCHLCGQVFPNRTSRTQHYKVSHQNDILTCSKCTSMFSSPEELAVHMKKHNLYKKKQCKTCGKFFSRLEKHIVTHKAKTEIDESELFVCDKCPKKFTNRSSFQRHLTIHSHDKPYQCPNCPRRFADCGVLRKHLRRHLSLMPYECEVCGKKCKEPGNLKVHMRIHSDTKQFQCPVCPQAFNYKSSLGGHLRSCHSQNLNTASLLPQVTEVRQRFDSKIESDTHQSYRSSRPNPSTSQLAEGSAWKLQLDPSQTFTSTPNIEMKQYYENRADVCMKPLYEGNGINPVNLMARQSYQVHPVHLNHIQLDVASKHTYIQDAASLASKNTYLHDSASVSTKKIYMPDGASIATANLRSAYTREGHTVTTSQPHEESSLNVTSLDVTTLNMSSMNISLY